MQGLGFSEPKDKLQPIRKHNHPYLLVKHNINDIRCTNTDAKWRYNRSLEVLALNILLARNYIITR